MSSAYDWLLSGVQPGEDPLPFWHLARALKAQGELALAATAYDRAYGLAPTHPQIAMERSELLTAMAVTVEGLRFCYIPAGSFLMGAEGREPDEAPVHPVTLDAFWLSETCLSLSQCDALMGENEQHFSRLRYRYSEPDWETPSTEEGELPLVDVGRGLATLVAEQMSNQEQHFRLPTEAEWEKAARGGLIQAPYPWGHEPPTPALCDFDRFDDFAIRPMRSTPPNGYGLYAMSGSVWEWTADVYDALFYSSSPRRNPHNTASGEEYVLRGGSWADCAEVVTCSFRMSHQISSFYEDSATIGNPNFGFRLVRTEAPDEDDEV